MSDSQSRSAARLARALEEAERMAARGESDPRLLAARCSIEADSAERLLAGVLAFEGALAPDAQGSTGLPASLPAPELPDDYELGDEIGRGGMGVVYRAHQRSLDRDVAVKVLMPGELRFASTLDRFRLEAQSLAKLRHRHIVAIHEIGDAGGNLFYSMDLFEGGSLAERLKSGPLSAAQAARVLRQVASAIAYTHGAGVVHRDLKPANVLFDTDGDAYVVDFGLALDVAWDRGLTSTGNLLGTPDYMSPEQARGDRERIGEASDIYALGAILYSCLTGEAPFGSLPLADKIHRVVYDPPTAPRRRNPRVPRDLETICLKAMSKRPEDRYATARALLEDLERFEEGRSIRARRPNPVQVARRFVVRHARELVVAGVVALAALGLARKTLSDSAQGSFSRRIEDVRRLLVAGEARAARMMLDETLASAGRLGLDRDRELLLTHVSAGCDLELANELSRAGRSEEARGVFERVTEALERGMARTRYSRETGWPAIRFEMAADLAIAQVQLGDTQGALETFSSFHGGLVRQPWTGRLLEWMAPRLADPSAAGHPAAVLIVSQGLDWATPGAFGAWLAQWPDLAPDMLEGLLGSLDTLPPGRRGFVEAGLVRRSALASPALRAVVARRDNHAVTVAHELEQRLAHIAADPARPEGSRALATGALVNLADLPFRLVGPTSFDARRVQLLLEGWEQSRWAPDRRAALAQWLSATGLPEAVQPDAEHWRESWFGELGEPDPFDESEVLARLERLPELDERAARATHRALERDAPEGRPVPFWPVWGEGVPREVLQLGWRSALGLEEPGYRLSLAHVVWLEGSYTPQVLWVRQHDLLPGERTHVRVVERDVHRVFRKELGLDWLGVRSPTLKAGPPGTLVLELDGSLELDGGGVVFDIEHFDYDLFIGGSKDWWSARRAGETLLAGRVAPLGYREYGWPRHGTHASVELVLAVIDPLLPDGELSPGSAGLPFDPRSFEAWRARLAAQVQRDGAHLNSLAIPDPQDLTGERMPSREPLETWIAALPIVQRVALANQWILGGILPLPEARAALAANAAALRASGAFGSLLDLDAPFPQNYEPGSAFERTIAQLAAARLAAGDAGPVEEDDVSALLADFPLTSTQWAHRVLDAEDERIRDFALAQLDSKFTSDALWCTLGREADERGLPLPDRVRERIAAAPRRLLAEELNLAGAGTWTGAVLPVFSLLFLWLMRRRRSRLSDRVGLAGCSLLLAFFSLGRTLQIGPVPVVLAPFAVLLAWVAVSTLWKSVQGTRARRGYGFALAFVAALALASGLGDAARPLLRAGMLLALFGFPPLLEAILTAIGLSAPFIVTWVGYALRYVSLPLGGLLLLRTSWTTFDGRDPLQLSTASLGIELDFVERILSGVVYGPVAGLVLGLFTAALLWSHRLRESEKLARDDAAAVLGS